ncbi:PadR family transcriptional regulator [Microbacterium marinilacus]|uniref:Helix-turn-helix transcriptional regulator n=1 Tax=Microbacterium marinilacus TaxID=415209 RepID=A0ABP7BV41_9MICO|nr:PadR family transcriptional regulator [Microbacterium marinilacus]MBY0688100.1 PadR family transcriptional regulator [Microbacterium marinilacus]
MSLRYALLALLRVGPLSGYDLQKQFQVSVGHLWHAPDSQIYPELRKMENDGLVVGEDQTRGERGTRRVYHLTDEGEQDYVRWMESPLSYARVREPANLKAAYLEAASPDAARAFLHEHIRHWSGEVEQWEAELARIDARANPMLMRRLESIDQRDHDRTVAFKRFGYEGLVDRARSEIDWAERGLALIDELYGPENGTAGHA